MPSVKLSVTIRKNLANKYSVKDLKALDSAVKGWIAADAKRGFRTIHVALDDVAAMKALGVASMRLVKKGANRPKASASRPTKIPAV